MTDNLRFSQLVRHTGTSSKRAPCHPYLYPKPGFLSNIICTDSNSMRDWILYEYNRKSLTSLEKVLWRKENDEPRFKILIIKSDFTVNGCELFGSYTSSSIMPYLLLIEIAFGDAILRCRKGDAYYITY